MFIFQAKSFSRRDTLYAIMLLNEFSTLVGNSFPVFFVCDTHFEADF